MRIWHCHYCGTGSISGPGNFCTLTEGPKCIRIYIQRDMHTDMPTKNRWPNAHLYVEQLLLSQCKDCTGQRCPQWKNGEKLGTTVQGPELHLMDGLQEERGVDSGLGTTRASSRKRGPVSRQSRDGPSEAGQSPCLYSPVEVLTSSFLFLFSLWPRLQHVKLPWPGVVPVPNQ